MQEEICSLVLLTMEHDAFAVQLPGEWSEARDGDAIAVRGMNQPVSMHKKPAREDNNTTNERSKRQAKQLVAK